MSEGEIDQVKATSAEMPVNPSRPKATLRQKIIAAATVGTMALGIGTIVAPLVGALVIAGEDGKRIKKEEMKTSVTPAEPPKA